MFLLVAQIIAALYMHYTSAFQHRRHSVPNQRMIKPHTACRRAEVKMTGSSTPWSHTDLDQSSTWLEDGNRIEYLETIGTESQFASLADAIGLNISNDVTERSIIPHHLTVSSN